MKKATDDANAERQRLLDEAKRMPMPCCQTPGGVGKRTTEPECRDFPLDPKASLCHYAQDTGRSRRHKPRGTHGRRIRRPRACLAGAAKEQMATAFKTSNHTVSVHSAFDMPPAQKNAIEIAVKETFAPDAQVQFETAPELISGIELSTNGHKIAWSIADYLSTLEKSAAKLLNQDAKPEPKPDAKSKPTRPSPSQRPKPSPSQRPKPSPSQRPKPSPNQRPKPSRPRLKPGPGRSVNRNTRPNRCPRPQRRTIE